MAGKKDKGTADLELEGGENAAPEQAGEGEAAAEQADDPTDACEAPDEAPQDPGESQEEVASEEGEPRELRDFGYELAPADPYALLSQIEQSDEVEIAFLDAGCIEIAELLPHHITDEDAWGIGAGDCALMFLPGRAMRRAIAADAPAPVVLDGYALVLDGELAALAKRSEPLRMGAGMTYDLSGDVAFG